jgi:uncharacterized membrane protein
MTPASPTPQLRPRITRIFIAGILAILPLLATAVLLIFAAKIAIEWLGPSSGFGKILIAMGFGVTGSEWAGYAIGLALVCGLIFVLGFAVEKGLQKWFHSLVDGLVGRIPVVRTIYETIRQFLNLVARKDNNDALNSMQPVWCQFGGKGGVTALALLSSSQPVYVNNQLCYAVIIPTAPVPIGGGLLFVPVDWIANADIGMDALTSIYVSMGVTAPQFIKPVPSIATPVTPGIPPNPGT